MRAAHVHAHTHTTHTTHHTRSATATVTEPETETVRKIARESHMREVLLPVYIAVHHSTYKVNPTAPRPPRRWNVMR